MITKDKNGKRQISSNFEDKLQAGFIQNKLEKMTKFNYMYIFRKMSEQLQKVTCTSSYVHNNCAGFEKCQPEAVR
jgi:hypothetical protein